MQGKTLNQDADTMNEFTLHTDRPGPQLPSVRGVMTEWMHSEGGVDPGRTVDPEGVELGYGRLLPLEREDIQLAADLGVNTIRCAVEHASLEDRDRPGAYNEAGFARVAQLLDWFDEAGIDAVLDLHNALGREGGGDPRLWQQREYQDRFCNVWGEIARRFADHPRVVAFEPLNEPEPRHVDDMAGRYAAWNHLSKRVTDTLRAVDADKPIIIDSIEYANPAAFEGLEPTGDVNTVYSFHWYGPSAFHCQKRPWIRDQGTYHYPGEFKDGWWNRDRIRQAWQPPLAFAREHGAGLFCGEFGCVSDIPEMEDMIWLLDVISLLDELGIGWTYYHFLFRTVEPYWQDHFDCNIFIRDLICDQLRTFSRKAALLGDLMTLRGQVVPCDAPDHDMLHLYAVDRGEQGIRVYLSNRSPDAPAEVGLRLGGDPRSTNAKAARMDQSTEGFAEGPALAFVDGHARLSLDPLSMVRIDL